jgi:hypothetical protein
MLLRDSQSGVRDEWDTVTCGKNYCDVFSQSDVRGEWDTTVTCFHNDRLFNP